MKISKIKLPIVGLTSREDKFLSITRQVCFEKSSQIIKSLLIWTIKLFGQ
jgi:hypothetical protein